MSWLILLMAVAWAQDPTPEADPGMDPESDVPALTVAVTPLATMPRPEIGGSPAGSPLAVAERPRPPRIDGTFEAAWSQATPADRLRSLIYQGPPHPDWSVRGWVSETDLSLALGAVPAEADVVVTVDPTGARRGWVRLTLTDGRAIFQDCRPGSGTADLPRLMEWSVATWACGPELPGAAAHGPDGWELSLPWSALGPTTDDLQINVRISTETHSLSLEPSGTTRDFTARGRTLERTGHGGRRDVVTGRFDRTTNALTATLSTRPEGPELWSWTVAFAGEDLASGHLEVSPEQPVQRFTVPDLDPNGVLHVLTRRVGPEPLAPGAWRRMISVHDRGTLSTPVFVDHLNVRLNLDEPRKEVPVQVRDARGSLLGQSVVDLPRNTSDLRIEAEPTWPDRVEVRVGDLLVEGWLPALRVGTTRRRLGDR